MRLRQQILDLIMAPYEPIAQWFYDRSRPSRVKVFPGQVKFGEKVALVLLFQPKGVAGSVDLLCKRLIESSYSPFLVSNTDLSDMDLARLRSISSGVMIRPNFGYDFGGYRDGVWYLCERNVHPERLILMNDSVWYPAKIQDEFIELMEALSGHFCGALMAEDRRSRRNSGRGRAVFLSSFWLMFDRVALESSALQAFWKNYRCSNSKRQTIRRGERGLSARMVRAGFQPMAVFDRRSLDQMIDDLPDAAVFDVLKQLALVDEELCCRRIRLESTYDGSTTWLKSAREFLTCATDGQNFLSTAPLLCLSSQRVAYIKKSRDVQNSEALRVLGAALDSGKLQLSSVVAQEISAVANR